MCRHIKDNVQLSVDKKWGKRENVMLKTLPGKSYRYTWQNDLVIFKTEPMSVITGII